jgi:ribosomal protein S18 acetylase RimI-like enzyme
MTDQASRPEFVTSVRRGGPADAEALAWLRWRWRVDEGTETGDLATFHGAFATWMRQHETSHVPFLAQTGPSPVGMAWVALVERVPGPSRWLRRAAYIQSVYVVPEGRSRGIGAQLLQAAIGHARSEQLDYLAVHPSERSFSLYRRLGFAETPRVLELELEGR